MQLTPDTRPKPSIDNIGMTSRTEIQRTSNQILQASRKSCKLIADLSLRTSLKLNNKLTARRVKDIDIEEVEREQSLPQPREDDKDFVNVVFGLHRVRVYCVSIAAALAVEVAHCVAHFIVVGD